MKNFLNVVMKNFEKNRKKFMSGVSWKKKNNKKNSGHVDHEKS